jgi:hypothetical protein
VLYAKASRKSCGSTNPGGAGVEHTHGRPGIHGEAALDLHARLGGDTSFIARLIGLAAEEQPDGRERVMVEVLGSDQIAEALHELRQRVLPALHRQRTTKRVPHRNVTGLEAVHHPQRARCGSRTTRLMYSRAWMSMLDNVLPFERIAHSSSH